MSVTHSISNSKPTCPCGGFVLAPAAAIPLSTLQPFFHDLPVDTYLAQPCRLRRFTRLQMTDGRMTVIPSAPFTQTAKFNPLLPGVARAYAALLPELVATRDFQDLVTNFVACCDGTNRTVEVGVHQIRVIATTTMDGLPVPEGKHRDGFEYVGIFCVARCHIVGGATQLFATEEASPVIETPLEPGALLVFDDRAFMHYTTPIQPETGHTTGSRDMFVFTLHGEES